MSNRIDIVTNETMALTKSALLAKNVTVGSGLVWYDLQAPAKNLYPVITMLRNSVPRVQRQFPGDAARWKTISSITGSGFDAMGWVPEGQRTGSMSYSAVPVVAPYVTIGEEDTVTFEAEAAAQGFEDINATASLRVLQKTMLKEEIALLGGNATLQLGTPGAPTLSASGSGATLPTATYSVIVVCLTAEGFRNWGGTVGSVSTGAAVPLYKTITGNDGNTFTLNAGVSNKSNNTTQAITLGQTLSASLGTIPNGTVAYAWYVGTVGSEVLQSVTTINSATFAAALVTGTQSASAITADYSANAGLAYDGFLTIGSKASNAAYYTSLATGTAGTGTYLTASGRGSVIEIDNMLLAMWNNYRITPTVIYVNAQEQKNITLKCLSNSAGPLLHYQQNDGANYKDLHASGVVRWYYNPFSVDGGFDIPIKVHPFLPPGTIMAVAETLPAWYQNNGVEHTFAVLTRRDYYRIDWPIRTRRREFGVYCEPVLAAYAPFAIGIITNISNG